MDYIIEKASPADAETIAGFQVTMAKETEDYELDLQTVIRGVRLIFDEPARGFYVVGRDSAGRTVGSLLVLNEWSDWRNTDVWWLHSLYVSPGHRKRGVFRKMLEYVESLAGAAGVAGIRLYVEKTNTDAKAVYENLGLSNRHYELYEKMF